MIESAYIDATQAVSWIAFRNFEVISQTLSSQRATLQKWQVSDMNTLLDCLEALERGQSWSLEQWRKETGYAGAQLDLEHVKNVIRESEKSVSELHSELIRDYDKTREVIYEAQKAESLLLEYLDKEIVGLRGIRKDGDGHPESFPLGIIKSAGFSILWKNTFPGVKNWQYLEIARADVLEYWKPQPASEEKSASGAVVIPLPRPRASEETVRAWFIQERLPLQQTESRHPSRNDDWEACREHFQEKARLKILTKVRNKCLEEHNIIPKSGRPRKTG